MKILFLTSRFPYPLEKGDKLRAYHQLQYLAQRHQVTLVALSDRHVAQKDLDHVRSFCPDTHVYKLDRPGILFHLAANMARRLPFQVAYFFRPRIKENIDALIRAEQPDVIYCQLLRTAEYVRDTCPSVKVLDYMDVMSVGMERISGRSGPLIKLFARNEHKRLLQYEQDIFEDFDAHTIISEQDRSLIPHPQKESIRVIPNGVDMDFYQPNHDTKVYDIAFVGNMSYKPNVESALFIGRQLLPLLRKQKPGIRIVIAGASPTGAVRDMASEHLEVTGWVDDVRQYLGRSAIHLAPMLINTGLQNKILQAMAMKVPCVVSPMANNAIGAPESSCVAVGNDPQGYVDKIMHLLNNPQEAELMAENAYLFVQKYFSWDAHNASLENLFTTLTKQKNKEHFTERSLLP